MLTVPYDSLADAIRGKLDERAADPVRCIVGDSPGERHTLFWALAGIAWLLALFAIAYDFRWSPAKIIILSLLSVPAAYLVVRLVSKKRAENRSRPSFTTLITPHYVVCFENGLLSAWNLDELDYVRTATGFGGTSGAYISLSLNGSIRTFAVAHGIRAPDVVEQIELLRKGYIEASAREDRGFFTEFGDLEAVASLPPSPEPRRAVSVAVRVAMSIVLAATTVAVAYRTNLYWEDQKSWDAAVTADRADGYAGYLAAHPDGRWNERAKQRLNEIYEMASRSYLERASKDGDAAATRSMMGMLENARNSLNNCVAVNFTRRNTVPPGYVEGLKEEYGYVRILNFDDSFSDAKMEQRESGVITALAETFRTVIADDVLKLAPRCDDGGSRFVIDYTVVPDDLVWFDLRQERFSPTARTWYPGVYFNWNFTVEIPGHAEAYRFSMKSAPAETIDYDGANASLDGTEDDFGELLKRDLPVIYNSMAASAFNDFRSNLIHKFGIGPAPVPDAEPRPKRSNR